MASRSWTSAYVSIFRIFGPWINSFSVTGEVKLALSGEEFVPAELKSASIQS